MASDNPKILGQVAPATGYTAGALVAAPSSGHSAIVTSIIACNTSGAARLIRIYARIANAATAVGNAIAYDVSLPANTQIAYKLGIVLGATDTLTAASDLGGVTFTAFGNDFTI